jgi:putative FmdB family regulatory protein
MPIYEYICDNCGFRFEIIKAINENSGINCQKCNNSARWVYPSVPFILGGKRWVGEIKNRENNTSKDKLNSARSDVTKK